MSAGKMKRAERWRMIGADLSEADSKESDAQNEDVAEEVESYTEPSKDEGMR